ncbi:MAG: cytochrome c biogenesis protein CcdA, partial [Candidatus Berkiella sp.]
MAINIVEIGLSFIEGLALIASPCILPVLPITLSASIEGGKARPYGIILGFILCFSFFALGAATLLRSLSIDLDLLKTISLVLLASFGLVLIFKPLFAIYETLTQRLNNVALINIKQKNGFISGLFIGGLIGFVWTPCAGPILASALIQVIRQESSLNSFLLVVSFSLGVSIPMLMIALIGRDIVIRLGFLQKNAQAIRMILGVLILLSVVYMMSDYQLFTSASKTEEQPIQSQSMELINPLTIPYKAPDFEGISAWLNSTPLTMASLKGKVVLIDFWTYSCINCIRTLPYITAWDKKYREDGLVIVGVHSPEFEFERKISNIEDAIKRFGINYPVAVDNGLNTWQAYHNLYWPAHYLIDKSGQVVYTHFGEGAYNITEHNIKVLLDKNKASNTIESSENSPYESKSPETYLGYFRFEHFANASQFEKDKTQL